MRKKQLNDKNGVQVRFKFAYDAHDGYCSDHDEMEEVVCENYCLLPATVDQAQLSNLRWYIESPGHCCCGATTSWSEIKIVSEPRG